MPEADDKQDWFDVLVGKRDPRNREDLIFSELRQRVLDDASSDTYQLSELDLQRGKKALRAASSSQQRARPIQPFLSGLAAGIVAAGFGMSIFLTQFDEPDSGIDKGLPDIVGPSIQHELSESAPLSASLPALVSVLSIEGIPFTVSSDGTDKLIQFKTPAPVPESLADWLESNGVESLAVTTYQLSFKTKTAR